jgi:aminopeptidase N
MINVQPVAISRFDYKPPAWSISSVELHFDLDPRRTQVRSNLGLVRQGEGPLRLNGVDLTLISIAVDGRDLTTKEYQLAEDFLEITELPDNCDLEICVEINPEGNTALEGLYLSTGNFCTQCEAEGFRKITYFLDRPDVLSVYTVSMKAPLKSFPVLLSNGNCIAQSNDGEFGFAKWHDPFPKPSYLFALVAGDLSHIKDSYTTASGRGVDLYIYVEKHNLDKCDFGMQALKRSMRWDEETYGLEYDLDRYMIVAVDDFNMGAMENKGLNVFNSKYVLADADTATDADFIGVESVIAHEYFHNWSGNRVTCRDWFQLSLKEGLTVFRDQEFTADMHDRTVKRIEDVRLLRARQFPEDASPMAHPVRPDSYIEINNFYTLTVYEKGAELIRMMHTLLGAQAYREGIDLYFKRHDGQAVTCDDFVKAMQDASGIDLTQFTRWYSQAGTPEITVTHRYDERDGRYFLTLSQYCPDTPGQKNKQPMHIPVLVGLLDESGNSVPLPLADADSQSTLLNFTQKEQTFSFESIPSKPVLSIFRQFSAPIKLVFECSDDDLCLLMGADADAFNRWDASQRMASRLVERIMADSQALPSDAYLNAIGLVINDDQLDPFIKAEVLSLPSLDTLAEAQELVDITKLHGARTSLQKAIATRYQDQLTQLLETQLQDTEPYTIQHMAMGKRKLANCALGLLTNLGEKSWLGLATEQYRTATNMTDRVAALSALMYSDSHERRQALDDFYKRYESQRLVIDKWFSIQATAPRKGVIDTVIALSEHEAFELSNPNRVRSLIGAFAAGNPVGLHGESGRGYRLVADYVLTLDAKNPQIAARLIGPLTRWRRYAQADATLMKEQLTRIAAADLSPDVFEIVNKSVQS